MHSVKLAPTRTAIDGCRMLGNSERMRAARGLALRMAESPAKTILITGETGVGKDLAARFIHASSGRAGEPFVNITCSALPEALLESELFGHERGAFTSAHTRKNGLFEEAAGGTVFLDEVGEMSIALQAKLLRFLEDHSFRRVGGLDDRHTDVRVIAATNRDLAASVAQGRFREDLYYRLSVLHLAMPPLRERPDDVLLLSEHFLRQYSDSYQKDIHCFSQSALEALYRHDWPGNVRELKNTIERAVLLCDAFVLERESISWTREVERAERLITLPDDGLDLEALERDLVLQALVRVGGNRTHAAQLLGLSRDQIRHRIVKFGLCDDGLAAQRSHTLE